MLGPADQVGPFDHRVVVELEAPVRLHAVRFQSRARGVGQRQRGAIIDGWQPAPQQDLALQLQFLRRFIGGIDAPRGDQIGESRFIDREARRLAFLAIGRHPQPVEIAADRLDEPLLASLGIGIVDAQHETAAVLLCPQPVVQRRANVADVQPAGRRGGETGKNAHALALTQPLDPPQCPLPVIDLSP